MMIGFEIVQYICLSEQSFLIFDGIDFFYYVYYFFFLLINKVILFGIVRYFIIERLLSKIDL